MSVRAVAPSLLGWPVWASVGAHAVALATATTVVALSPPAPPAHDLIPIEMVRMEPLAPPPPPPPKPKPAVKISAPRLVTQPAELAQPIPQAPALLKESRRENAPAVTDQATAGNFLAGVAASSSWSIPGKPGGDTVGKGKLFAVGDLPVAGKAGGSGSNGGAGGDGSRLDGKQVAVKGNPEGLTSFAHPLGGYQTQPRYPDSARRQGIEGETLLRFQVLTTGRVAAVAVARSAGHRDLDRAAMEAVGTWLFEPARRGKEAVAVWVTLPVRFRLHSGIGD